MMNTNGKIVIEGRNGSEQHSSAWGKFYCKNALGGWLGVLEDSHRDRHESYGDFAAELAPGTLFTVFTQQGDRRGTQDMRFAIAQADAGAEERTIAGGCYGRGGRVTGRFRLLADANTKTKARRLLGWWQDAPERTERYARHLGEQIAVRGRAVPDPLPCEAGPAVARDIVLDRVEVGT